MEIEVYETASGKKPFEIWLDKIKDGATIAKILNRLDRLNLGSFGDCKPLKGGIYELRLHYGAGLRIYYSKVKNKIVLLLCGGDKSSQKKDIQKAREYLEDYKKWEARYGKK